MKTVLTLLISIILLGSCTTNNSVVSNSIFQKRKYRKGYHFNLAKKSSQKTKSVLIKSGLNHTTDLNHVRSEMYMPNILLMQEEDTSPIYTNLEPLFAATTKKSIPELRTDQNAGIASYSPTKKSYKKDSMKNQGVTVDEGNFPRTNGIISLFSFMAMVLSVMTGFYILKEIFAVISLITMLFSLGSAVGTDNFAENAGYAIFTLVLWLIVVGYMAYVLSQIGWAVI